MIFGLSGLLLIYFILPILIRLVQTKYINILLVCSIVLCSLFLVDDLYNLFIANLLKMPRASAIYKKIGVFKVC